MLLSGPSTNRALGIYFDPRLLAFGQFSKAAFRADRS